MLYNRGKKILSLPPFLTSRKTLLSRAKLVVSAPPKSGALTLLDLYSRAQLQKLLKGWCALYCVEYPVSVFVLTANLRLCCEYCVAKYNC